MTITGGCRCGAVCYTIEAERVTAHHCWCRDCQYIGAGSGTVNVFFPSETVTVRAADAAAGDPANAPYDVIVLDGATEITPEHLYQQLRDGGRLVGVFAQTRPPRAMIVTRSHGDFGNRALFDAAAPVLPGLERLPAFVF